MPRTNELVEKFMDTNNLYRTEGEAGVRNLETLIRALGYERTGFKYGEVIEVFLADNPGAVEKLFEWIGEQTVVEWNERLMDHVDYEDCIEEDDNE